MLLSLSRLLKVTEQLSRYLLCFVKFSDKVMKLFEVKSYLSSLSKSVLLSSSKENAMASLHDPSLWPLLQILKMFPGLISPPAVGFNCTLLCRLFLFGFPGREFGMLWHSRSFECAISQATWHREIALNSLSPLKRWDHIPTKRLKAGALIGGQPLFHGASMFTHPWNLTDDSRSVWLFLVSMLANSKLFSCFEVQSH